MADTASKPDKRRAKVYASLRWQVRHRDRYLKYKRQWARRDRACKREAASQ